MTYKTIFTGRLEFGNARSYDKVLKMYQHRVENYYKSDVLLNEEDIFDQEASCLNVPRYITQGSEKSWKNTYSLLEYIAQFAVSGNLVAWMTEEGKILHHGIVEPQSDKVAVQQFLKGKKLLKEKGKESEAMEALNRAIEKYERHAQAYERRGQVNFLLKNYEDAIYDYSKSIDISAGNPEPYFGRATVHVLNGDLDAAIDDFAQAVKKSIPLQSIYWKSRRFKGECLMKKEDYAGALQDFKFFTRRNFKADDPNLLWKRQCFYNYGICLMKTEAYVEAVEAFQESINLTQGNDNIPEGDKWMHLGTCKEKAGKTGFLKAWKKAVELGSAGAKAILKNRK